MEGVGARLGRSSTRYGGPTTVFSGPVRKWKKKWVQVPSPSSSNSANHSGAGNGGANNSSSHLVLYKWTPISSSNGNSSGASAAPAVAAGDSGKEAESAVAVEEPPQRKFRYVPVSVIEEQKQEAAAKIDDEAKPSDSDASPKMQHENLDSKSGTNDILMEEAEALGKNQAAPQDKGEANLDLSLGLKALDDKCETGPKSTGQAEGT